MNSFLKITTSALSIAFCISLTSCEKDSLLSPMASDARSSDNFREAVTPVINPTIPKKYTLIKMGGYELTYQADGKLAGVKKGNKFTTYEYLPNLYKIIAHSWQPVGNGYEEYRKIVIDLYGGTSAARAEIWAKSNNSNALYKIKTLAFTYENHRLIKCNDEDSPYSNKSTIFTYNNDGDLTSAKVQNYNTVFYVDQYTYGGSGSPLKDSHPYNPQFSFFGEGEDEGTELMFLPVFGTFNKHLVQTVSRIQNAPYKVLFNYAYKYDLNADGHVTERERWNQTINQKIATDLYQYKVENLAINP
ncbi:hypothetical protein IC229_16235 [Spirosoma sp. BT702]|uniref:DUF4595 domain-containing protein n=1 Tax=Spirosoma profusum TaxID=2771354 RepID=A0A926XWZ3_9BACT|nr:hypothetical protein [Spirosoma profusum]MBD2702202.1 hypothetical protein [Spirosoma profusum]